MQALPAQTFDPSKIDKVFSEIAKNNQGMGSISLFEHGQEIYHYSFGFADLKNRVKPGPDTQYGIGSVTKMFTATIILQLVAEGKLNLNSTLSPYYPEIPHAKRITIEQLLQHRSGLTDQKFQKWLSNGKDFKQTTKAEYANVNYGLLSIVAEKVENQDFGAILSARIFKPCKLKNTFYGKPPDSIGNLAKSYYFSSGWKSVPSGDLLSAAGAGAIVSNPTDLNSFLVHLFSGQLLPQNSLAQMQRIVDGYGSGMMQIHFAEKIAYSHAGQIAGFQSRIAYFPKEDFAISYCFNGVAMSLDKMLVDVLQIYFNR